MNVNAVAVRGRNEIDPSGFAPDQVDLIKRTIAKGATDDELRLFLHQCQRTGLDPLARQIYAVKRWDNRERREVMAIQVSIDGFRLIAERTGKYAGQVGPYWCSDDGQWVDVWTRPTPPAAAKVGVLRSDFKEPLFGVARFLSYAQKTKDGGLTRMWGAMSDLMVAKCAEALALRRAFPQELAGLYTTDEMQQADNGREPQPAPAGPLALAAPAEAPADPETGEIGPRKIGIPEAGGHKNWIAFGSALIAGINAATDKDEIDAWLRLNSAEVKTMEADAPKAHAKVKQAVVSRRQALAPQDAAASPAATGRLSDADSALLLKGILAKLVKCTTLAAVDKWAADTADGRKTLTDADRLTLENADRDQRVTLSEPDDEFVPPEDDPE